MKAISRAIERFCQKHRKFGVPRLMLYIVFISAAVFVIHQMDRTQTLLAFLIFDPDLILRGQVWRLLTWLFLPLNNNIFFTAIMLYFYYFIGSTLEREWGAAKFTVYYIFGVILNIIYGFLIRYLFMVVPYIVPNFINLSMFFAFAVLFPDHRILLFFIIPIKIKWLAIVDACFFAYSIITEMIFGYVVMALLPIVALLNFFIICGSDMRAGLRPLRANASPNTINYKKAAKKARREDKSRPYRHKCAVCGKTDVDSPDAEFRYCSRCNGYHCYCLDHINNHIHFQ